MQVEFRTDRGRIRQHNEDNGGVFQNKNGISIVIVADGMGGHQAGDIASEMAVHTLSEAWQQTDSLFTVQEIEQWLKTHIELANQRILERAQREIDLKGMGTTLVAAIVIDSQLVVANIGDSRGYLFQNNKLTQLTEDHSLVHELMRKGEITAEDAFNHPRKNILLRALGVEKDVVTDTFVFPIQTSDILLLCSDGLTNMLSEQEIEAILASGRTLAEKANIFIAKANDKGGEDNITVLLAKRKLTGRGESI